MKSWSLREVSLFSWLVHVAVENLESVIIFFYFTVRVNPMWSKVDAYLRFTFKCRRMAIVKLNKSVE